MRLKSQELDGVVQKENENLPYESYFVLEQHQDRIIQLMLFLGFVRMFANPCDRLDHSALVTELFLIAKERCMRQNNKRTTIQRAAAAPKIPAHHPCWQSRIETTVTTATKI